MKKQFVVLGVAALVFGGIVTANATVVGVAGTNNVVYDDLSQKYWVNNLTLFTAQWYTTQKASIDTLNYNGAYIDNTRWTNWHMADLNDITALFGNGLLNLTSQFIPTLNINGGAHRNWYGRYDEVHPFDNTVHGRADITYQTSFPDTKSTNLTWESDFWTQATTSVWIVADTVEGPGPSPTPEPATMLLFGTGLVGLIGSRLRKKKTQ